MILRPGIASLCVSLFDLRGGYCKLRIKFRQLKHVYSAEKYILTGQWLIAGNSQSTASTQIAGPETSCSYVAPMPGGASVADPTREPPCCPGIPGCRLVSNKHSFMALATRLQLVYTKWLLGYCWLLLVVVGSSPLVSDPMVPRKKNGKSEPFIQLVYQKM